MQAAAELSTAATHGARCIFEVVDVRSEAAVDAAVGRIVAALGRLDVVVNNAAGNFLCSAAHLSGNAFRTVLEIDVQGMFHVCKVCAHRSGVCC